jgi:DNA adenine methylase
MDPAATVAPHPALRPFLKWAGGKRQLLAELRRFVPAAFGAYHEPFLGSGAMFFDLWRRGRIADRRCTLTDINADLVGCYTALARDVDGVVRELRVLRERHEAGGADHYYRIRDELFNPKRRSRQAAGLASYPVDIAAMFIYLNRTGYNGLFRLNSRGDFNVPMGRYANPGICDETTLRAVSDVLKRRSVRVRHDSFAAVEHAVQPGDFIYLDPPYVPLTETARFTSYTPTVFSDADQRRLRAVVLQLARGGCHVVLSNSSAPLVRDLYETPDTRRAGLCVHRVSARRAINSNGGKRGQIDEYIISNVEPSRG